MTRINAGIDPREMPRQMLLAEHKEITRIPNSVYSGRAKVTKPIPPTFRLGEGHVTFFYNKLPYLFTRYTQLYHECRQRGYNVTPKFGAFLRGQPPIKQMQWEPTERDRKIVLGRIAEKPYSLIPLS